MSNLDTQPGWAVCGGRAEITANPLQELLPGRRVPLGESTEVRRLLPTLGRRMVGAWCFVDHYGPDDVVDQPGMQVPPHPHMGLQTVSWLLDGEILHRDSLGSVQTLRPGQLGLMTAGAAISHSEESPRAHAPMLHGAQLWVALPDQYRSVAPDWEFHAQLPTVQDGGLRAAVVMGQLADLSSPGTTYSPLVGVDLTVSKDTNTQLPLEKDFEYAVLTTSGIVEADGIELSPGSLLYLGCGRQALRLAARSDGHALLLGGEPFAEQIVMWWNFIGRTSEEIAVAREDWMSGDRFGTVRGYHSGPLPAPALPTTQLKPRGRTR